jgi:hypothetical protein
VAIIGVLLGLLLPALAYSRFRTKVTVCSNNYRQWGVAVALYASDDGKGRLPSFALPVDRMAQYSSLEPWFVAQSMITNMSPYGVTVPMWFCPPRKIQGGAINTATFGNALGEAMSSSP